MDRLENEFLEFKEEDEASFEKLCEFVNQQDRKVRHLETLYRYSDESLLLKRAAELEALDPKRPGPVDENFRGDPSKEHEADILKDLLVIQLIEDKYPSRFEDLCERFEGYYGVCFKYKDEIEDAPDDIIETFNIRMDRKLFSKWRRHVDLQQHSDIICGRIIGKWFDSVQSPHIHYPAEDIYQDLKELKDLEFLEIFQKSYLDIHNET